jgi:hypothetical protein
MVEQEVASNESGFYITDFSKTRERGREICLDSVELVLLPTAAGHTLLLNARSRAIAYGGREGVVHYPRFTNAIALAVKNRLKQVAKRTHF